MNVRSWLNKSVGDVTDTHCNSDVEPPSGGRTLGEGLFVQQRGVQDVHGDAEGARQPELLAQPRQTPGSKETPLANLLSLQVIFYCMFLI